MRLSVALWNYACKILRPGGTIWATDVCVPISNLVECIKFAENEIRNYGLKAPMVGHVCDGNFHGRTTTIISFPLLKLFLIILVT